MADWKIKVNPIHIQEWDLYRNVCEYNTQNGKFQIKKRADAGIRDKEDTWIGFSKRFEKDVFGIFASGCGPVFFINSDMFLLCENEWSFEIVNISEKMNAFRFVYNGKVILDFTYERYIFLGTHPYSDESFEDFFVWMSDIKNNETFIDYYTVKE